MRRYTILATIVLAYGCSISNAPLTNGKSESREESYRLANTTGPLQDPTAIDEKSQARVQELEARILAERDNPQPPTKKFVRSPSFTTEKLKAAVEAYFPGSQISQTNIRAGKLHESVKLFGARVAPRYTDDSDMDVVEIRGDINWSLGSKELRCKGVLLAISAEDGRLLGARALE